MQTEFGREETQTEARARYLKEMMRVRGVTAQQLSDITGISKRTLERYMSGRTDPANAAGVSVAVIAHALSINAYILGGAEAIKPGASFSSNGKRLADTGQRYSECGTWWPRHNFKRVLDYNKLTPEMLSERSGVPCRTITDILAGRTDIRKVRANAIFKMCRVMIFHPYFLYELRDMREYKGYLQAYYDKRKEDKIKAKAMGELQEIINRLKADEGEE